MQKEEGRVTERNGISKEGMEGSISDKAYNATRDALLDLCACQSLGMHARDCTLHTCNAREMENSDGVPWTNARSDGRHCWTGPQSFA